MQLGERGIQLAEKSLSEGNTVQDGNFSAGIFFSLLQGFPVQNLIAPAMLNIPVYYFACKKWLRNPIEQEN